MTKPNITWIGYKFIAIVDHIMSGTLTGTDSWFANPVSKVSSHFGVGKNGEIHQYVDLDNPAWANGGVNNGHCFRTELTRIITPFQLNTKGKAET